jgi:hypothetical protein
MTSKGSWVKNEKNEKKHGGWWEWPRNIRKKLRLSLEVHRMRKGSWAKNQNEIKMHRALTESLG